MRSKMIFGALLVSVALCSQGFGFELLDRMFGLNCGGCGECNACAKVACCQPCAKVCCPEPACCAKPACCKPACCEPSCCEKHCGKCRVCRPTPVRDLFGNIKDLFEAKGYACEPCGYAASKGCCPEPSCCEKPACRERCRVRKVHCCEKACCAPACCEKPACCKPACCKPACCEPTGCETPCQPKCHKLYRRPLVELLENVFGECRCHRACGEAGCCETGCGCGCGGGAPVKGAPNMAPAKAPEAPAPLPAAPKADPSA